MNETKVFADGFFIVLSLGRINSQVYADNNEKGGVRYGQ